jgi:hypothetical protein
VPALTTAIFNAEKPIFQEVKTLLNPTSKKQQVLTPHYPFEYLCRLGNARNLNDCGGSSLFATSNTKEIFQFKHYSKYI